jgi:putative Holliday junction resolvase
VIVRSGDGSADRLAIAAAVRDAGAELVVVGLPVSLDGNEREPALAARRQAEALVAVLGVPVEMYDERHTTVVAARLRREGSDAGSRGGGRGQGTSRERRGRDGSLRPRRDRAKPIDAEAAAVMLQSWLDSRRGRPE